jgi:Ca2+/H+ antiporter, TMEM165/GDT1 family
MLNAFTAGFLLIGISELGDKTFCIAMLLAMRHSRRWVFVGVLLALVAMTLISVLLGQVVSLLPQVYLQRAEIALFIGFGLKLLYDAYRMKPTRCEAEVAEAEAAISQSGFSRGGVNPQWGIVTQAFMLTFVAEWGDRTQFATIALAASNNVWGVTIGAILGHALCAAIAVLGGRLIAAHLSERSITAIGGLLFIGFGIWAAIEQHA